MTTKTFTPIRGKRIRVTELSDCGAILPTSRQVVTDGFISVALTPNVEEGTDITQRRADGSICISERGNPSFTGFSLELSLCNVNPSLLAITTNAEEYEAAAEDIIGFTVPEGEISGRFALELWTGLAGVGCGDTGSASGYLLLPQVATGTLADLTVDGENAVTFGLTNAATVGQNEWESGPYKVLTTGEGLPTDLDPLDHLLMLFTDLAPPPVAEQPSLVTAD